MATDPKTLYDEDFYAWTVEQAGVPRSLSHGDNRLDIDHLAEEIEDLGKSELKAVENQVVNILSHLLTLDHSSLDWPRNHWRKELLAFRQVLRRHLTASMKRRILEQMGELYAEARDAAAASLIDSEPGLVRRLPKGNPYDWNAIESREDLRDLVAEQEAGHGAAKRRRRRGA